MHFNYYGKTAEKCFSKNKYHKKKQGGAKAPPYYLEFLVIDKHRLPKSLQHLHDKAFTRLITSLLLSLENRLVFFPDVGFIHLYLRFEILAILFPFLGKFFIICK